MKLIIDVRTREEFVKEHIKGALNIPHYDLQFHEDFLKDKDIILVCNTERRSAIAQKKLIGMGIESTTMTLAEQDNHEWVKNTIICAMNIVHIKEGQLEAFIGKAMMLCQATEPLVGFLGSRVLKADGMSGIGSFVPGDLSELKTNPEKLILLTYWTSKEAHEKSHHIPEFKELFDLLPEHLTQVPYEEFYEVMK
ncbi:MAG: hypothetical protein KAJ33_07135 [Thermoplasmata archaeon]|nr:hypothetical protein [Thermoplasmata archaeon]MCK5398004.1 hypothetical protein [Thermoplasmata archaeon]